MSEARGILTHDSQLATGLLGSFVRAIRWAMAIVIVGWFLKPSSWSPGDSATPSLATPSLIFAATFGFDRLLRTGRTRTVSWLLLLCPYLAALVGILRMGPFAPESLLVLGSIPFAALLLGLRVGIGFAFFQLSTLVLASLLFHPDRSGAPPDAPLEMLAVISILGSLLVAFYQEIPSQGLFSAVRISIREQDELDDTIARLESETQELSQLVKTRTEGLLEGNRNLARLSASLSHDLRAPLRSITEFAKRLAEHDLPIPVANQLQGIGTDVNSLQLILEKTMLSLRRETGS